MVLFCHWYSERAYIWICSASLTCNMVTSGLNPTKIFSKSSVFEGTRDNVNNHNPLRLHYLLGREYICTMFAVYKRCDSPKSWLGISKGSVATHHMHVGEKTKRIVVTTGTSVSGGRI
jgi:hypothetical protein